MNRNWLSSGKKTCDSNKRFLTLFDTPQPQCDLSSCLFIRFNPEPYHMGLNMLTYQMLINYLCIEQEQRTEISLFQGHDDQNISCTIQTFSQSFSRLKFLYDPLCRFIWSMVLKLLLTITGNMLNCAFSDSTTVVSQTGRFSPDQTKLLCLACVMAWRSLNKDECQVVDGRVIVSRVYRGVAWECPDRYIDEHPHSVQFLLHYVHLHTSAY